LHWFSSCCLNPGLLGSVFQLSCLPRRPLQRRRPHGPGRWKPRLLPGVTCCHRITRNHRAFGVGRDLWGSPSPTPLGHPQQPAQDSVQAGLEYLQRRRLHNLPGQPVPVLALRPGRPEPGGLCTAHFSASAGLLVGPLCRRRGHGYGCLQKQPDSCTPLRFQLLDFPCSSGADISRQCQPQGARAAEHYSHMYQGGLVKRQECEMLTLVLPSFAKAAIGSALRFLFSWMTLMP